MVRALDLSFLVEHVAPTGRAELFEGELVGRLLLVLRADVILPFAAVTDEGDQVSHAGPYLVAAAKPTTGFEPVTSFLPRTCSTT